MLLHHEIKKLIGNRGFVLYILLMLCLNLFLLWFFTRPNTNNPPQSAYKTIEQDMHGMDMEQKGDFLQERFDYAEAMYILENFYLLEQHSMPGDQYYEDEKLDNAEIIERYAEEYAGGADLRYTESIASEYAFINNIYREYNQVANYEQFLGEINDAANGLAAISIFADEDGYDYQNIVSTQEAYQEMKGVEIDYFPEMGLITATTFETTDVILIFSMILIAFALLQQEKQAGLLHLMRSTKRGRLATAFAKLCALVVSLLLTVLLLYGTNLVFCGAVFGLGDLTRSVQSVPELMRSTLPFNILQYLAAFMVTKWVAAIICALGIMLAMLFAKSAIGSVLLSLVLPGAFLTLRIIIPATGVLNLFRYANIIGYLRVEEILGTYRNLHLFGGVISAVSAQAVSAVLYTSLLLSVYLIYFTLGQFSANRESMTYLPRLRHLRMSGVFITELRKVLLLGGGLVILLIAVLYHGYDIATDRQYLTPSEQTYKTYLENLVGTYTEEKHEFLLSEHERFAEFIELEEQLRYGEITQHQYDYALSVSYPLAMEYEAFQTVMGNVDYISANLGAQFLYDTGYKVLFETENSEFGESFSLAVISVAMTVVMLCGFFSIERISGVRRILYSTPLGRERTVYSKLIISGALCFVVALINTLPPIITTARLYGMDGLLVNIKSIPQYSWLPPFVSILSVMIFGFLLRFVAVAFVGAVTLYISQLYDNYITVAMLSFSIFLLPLILTYIGLSPLAWLSVLPLFEVTSLMSQGALSTLIPVFYAAVMGFMVDVLSRRMVDRYSWNFNEV